MQALIFEEPELAPELGALAASAPAPRLLVWEVDESESEERPLPSASRPSVTGLRHRGLPSQDRRPSLPWHGLCLALLGLVRY